MRCRACDDLLSNREATRRTKSTGEFLDLCDRCYEFVKGDIPTVERLDNELVDSTNEEE